MAFFFVIKHIIGDTYKVYRNYANVELHKKY